MGGDGLFWSVRCSKSSVHKTLLLASERIARPFEVQLCIAQYRRNPWNTAVMVM
jgi:hypothetical protein